MFDPTAFENIKVVVEGALYDRDLEGEILITNRDDLMNLSKMSREFSVSFLLRNAVAKGTKASISISSSLENLAAELLDKGKRYHAGCTVKISFDFSTKYDIDTLLKVREILTNIWGEERTVSLVATINPFSQSENADISVDVSFNRLVLEDHIEDLANMVDYMTASLDQLQKILG
ncbi:hypothetical protein [Bacillus massilinigeriensis]|uniref:hypothetical protein n=1 Tax=Bacillus mediterraneensis TaxID=1805474 RepID=UPI0008F7EB11|nr:hypothetical protein [Bacillus mediterraneensis]